MGECFRRRFVMDSGVASGGREWESLVLSVLRCMRAIEPIRFYLVVSFGLVGVKSLVCVGYLGFFK